MIGFYEYGNPRYDGNNNMEDCYIRATCFATGIDYENISQQFIEKQQELKAKRPNDQVVVNSIMKDLGYRFIETINPRTSNGSMKIFTFLKKNKGKYILKAKGHMVYAENGKVIDTWDSSNMLLLGYWEI